MKRRPNILFVFADQMRAPELDPQVSSPHMDRLASEGTRFTRACANCPVCTPSRGTILTGRYPLSHRAVANDLPLPEDEVTIAELLRRAGYRTGYVGKWHLDGVPRDRFTPPGPRRHGFDFWAAWNCSHDYFHGRLFLDGPEPLELEGYEPVGQTDVALRFLAERDPRPFCLFLSWGPPHAPYRQVPAEHLALYDPSKVELRPNVRPTSHPGGSEPNAENIAGYYAHITALDQELGRLLGTLEERGLAEDTIVAFTSDHGDMLWSQGAVKKEQPWEESVRIPLLVRWPGRVPAGKECEALVSTVDLSPTLLGLTGVEVPEAIEGADLSNVFLGDDEAGPASVFLTEPIIVDQGLRQGLREWRGVRTARYTYARWADGERWLLYDNEADPHQMKNLIDSPGHASVRKELEEELQGWLRRTRDDCLPWTENVRRLGLVELWNARELELHPRDPRLLDGVGEARTSSSTDEQ